MANLAIVRIGAPVLRMKCQRIPASELTQEKFRKFLKDMVSTMHHAEGVGLAANQVGRGLQAVVLECKSRTRYPAGENVPLQTYLNPRIIEYSKELEEDWEGCLSIPGYRGLVPRSSRVTFEALNDRGEPVKKTVANFEARIIQHEVDHLNGLFYIDRMKDLHSWFHLDEFNRQFGAEVKDRK